MSGCDIFFELQGINVFATNHRPIANQPHNRPEGKGIKGQLGYVLMFRDKILDRGVLRDIVRLQDCFLEIVAASSGSFALSGTNVPIGKLRKYSIRQRCHEKD